MLNVMIKRYLLARPSAIAAIEKTWLFPGTGIRRIL